MFETIPYLQLLSRLRRGLKYIIFQIYVFLFITAVKSSIEDFYGQSL